MQSGDIGLIEAILFAAGDMVRLSDLCRWTGISRREMLRMLEQLADEDRALVARRFGEEVQLVTNPKYGDALQEIFSAQEQTGLSESLMETLTVIAYRQPVTRLEIEELRGVGCAYSISALCARGLVQRTGTREVLGHPAEYSTTDEFLRAFDLRSLNDLPPLILPDSSGS